MRTPVGVRWGPVVLMPWSQRLDNSDSVFKTPREAKDLHLIPSAEAISL